MWPVHLTRQMEREGLRLPRKVHSGKQAAGVAAGGRTAAPSGAVSSHRQVCRERRSRRDRGGATGTVAASRVFTHRTVAAARNRASGFGGDWRVRQQLPVGVGPDDRMPPAAGSRSGRNKDSQKR
ncbi:hypothetical protein IU399_00580 [Salmonella enterica subsp. enterica serovar Worthington]|nr:hypothetical protein [Salmonella enterica subsp. enterica serovar Worthington]